jgi:hypothetical protein
MPGAVVFALTARQAAVLRKLSAGSLALTESERVAFCALARRGLVRGSLDERSARLTHAGMIASLLAAELPGADRRLEPGRAAVKSRLPRSMTSGDLT